MSLLKTLLIRAINDAMPVAIISRCVNSFAIKHASPQPAAGPTRQPIRTAPYASYALPIRRASRRPGQANPVWPPGPAAGAAPPPEPAGRGAVPARRGRPTALGTRSPHEPAGPLRTYPGVVPRQRVRRCPLVGGLRPDRRVLRGQGQFPGVRRRGRAGRHRHLLRPSSASAASATPSSSGSISRSITPSTSEFRASGACPTARSRPPPRSSARRRERLRWFTTS